MTFSSFIGHERIKDALLRGLKSGALPQAMLFAGPAGIGKRAFALALAKALNCAGSANEACGRCPSCRRIDRGEHLDVTVLEPSTSQIKVQEIRELCAAAQTHPYEGRRRVLLIEAADTMNAQAQNSLLKTLEETPASAVILLLAEHADRLLPTIRSRCQRYDFLPLTLPEVVQVLKGRLQKPELEIELLARLSRGRPGVGLTLDLVRFGTVRSECLIFLRALSGVVAPSAVLEAAANWGKGLDRAELVDRLEALRLLLADLGRCLAGEGAGSLVNTDLAEPLAELSREWTIGRLSALSEQLNLLDQGLSRNLNRQLALEHLAFSLQGN
ncbi:MAG: DNA polymerase III subunit delta' [Acidobacteria bacterium]|nr:DNA polymerase III subunit delta' [Acidobacteriota bacterium]